MKGTKMNKEKIFKKCIKIWGNKKNKDQLIEEAAELIVAVRHFERGKTYKTQLIEEMVDVQMMIDICRDIYDISDEEFDEMFERKLDIVKLDLKTDIKKMKKGR